MDLKRNDTPVRDKITMMQALDYEIRGGGWAQWISWGWLQDKVGSYYANKVNRKYSRYIKSFENYKKQQNKTT